MLLEAEGEDGVFEGSGAVEAPVVLGDGLGEGGFERPTGARDSRMASQCFWKAAWSSGVDNDLSGEAVAEGVQRRPFLAFFGAGAGGELGIVAIGGELGPSHF